MSTSTRTTTVNRARLEYSIRGEGEPVVFIHGALAQAFVPLLNEPQLAGNYQLIEYSRRGWGNSERVGTIDIPAHAEDCVGLLDNLHIDRAHIIGHSYGPLVALQVALTHPERVHSLTLLETAVPSVLLNSPEVSKVANQVFAQYQAADVEGAFDTFFTAFLGPDFRSVIARALPQGAIARAILDMPTLLEHDFPALQTWSFGPAEAYRITQPTLVVVGKETAPLFRETHHVMQHLLPQAETFELPRANHALQMMNSYDLAAQLTAFLARHPLMLYA